jgi:hypothetical protein
MIIARRETAALRRAHALGSRRLGALPCAHDISALRIGARVRRGGAGRDNATSARLARCHNDRARRAPHMFSRTCAWHIL